MIADCPKIFIPNLVVLSCTIICCINRFTSICTKHSEVNLLIQHIIPNTNYKEEFWFKKKTCSLDHES